MRKKNKGTTCRDGRGPNGRDNMEDEDAEDDEDSEDDSDDFIDDDEPDEENGCKEEMKSITQKLMKQTPEDKRRKKKYYNSLRSYPLEIHKDTNPGLFVDPLERFRGNIRAAKRDVGMKEDVQVSEDLVPLRARLDNGKKYIIFPWTTTIDVYSGFCGLTSCRRQFEEHGTQIIKVSKKNNEMWICYDHII